MDKYQVVMFVFAGCSALVGVLAVIISRKIMVNQIFSDLIAEYRRPEMGGAILSLIHFYDDCTTSSPPKNICVEYEALYDAQIKNNLAANTPVAFSDTLHFQRRLVAQFYAAMGRLLSEPWCARPSKKMLKAWFGKDELELLKLLLLLSGPARNVFIHIDVPLVQAGGLTDKPITKLYEKVEKLLDKNLINEIRHDKHRTVYR